MSAADEHGGPAPDRRDAGSARPDPPDQPGYPPPTDPVGNQPTEVIPRRPVSEQPTTMLPRPSNRGYPPPSPRPPGPPPSGYGQNPYGASGYPPVDRPVQPPTYGSDPHQQGSAYRDDRSPGSGYRNDPPAGPAGDWTAAVPAAGGYRPGYPGHPGDPTAAMPPAGYAPGYPGHPDDPTVAARPADPDRTTKTPVPRGAHLPPYQETATAVDLPSAAGRTPRKLTVTRVAALRSRELTLRGVDLFHRATRADGADQSGLTHLTYAQMANYACDAALAVALANTLFLVKPEEGPARVLLYLLITVAPFAVVAPLIGPFLDRLQTGRRLALAVSMAGRGVLAIPMTFAFSGGGNTWVLYPCALGSLVLSKSFGVLKASLTPRVLPEAITLVATNSRLTVFGLIAGGVAGAIAAGLTWMFGSPGALVFTALLGFAGAVFCIRMPSWVESTEGEIPVHLRPEGGSTRAELTQPIRATLWANSSIRIETGFLAMFIAFVIMREYATESGFTKLLLVGVVGAAAGVGGFVGNGLGAKLPLRSPELISLVAVVVVVITTATAALVPGLAMAAVVGCVGSTASSLAKVCLDSVIQRDLPEVSRASAFGKSETALQMAWVLGGVVGLLIGGLLNLSHDAVYTIGFAAVTVLVLLGMIQTWLVKGGRSLLPQRTPRRKSAKGDGRPQPARNTDGSYTTRISYTDPPTTRSAPPQSEPPRSATPPSTSQPSGRPPRAAGSPRVDWSAPRQAGTPRPEEVTAAPGRRRLRHQKKGDRQ